VTFAAPPRRPGRPRAAL